ncbi:hypothetical protein AB2B38_009220 [Balneola sp. MJW-20]|uniref:hypothetical protein n=1 Tax=Gracilimonas aurantiaca TaxID=3234185 RepID=UPI003467E65B
MRWAGHSITIWILMMITMPALRAQIPDWLDLKGYVKELAQLSLDNGFSDLQFDNVIHHRLETEWTISGDLQLDVDLRSRLLNGYTVRNTTGLSSLFEADPNLVDLTKVWTGTKESLFYSEIDRFYLSYYNGPIEIYAGRQRINWARSYVWSPNDLFNNYAYLDFDYEERPGVDAVAAIWNLDFASSVEAGVRLGKNISEMVIAGMYRFNIRDYDLQFIAGHYYDKIALGFGWAGYIQDAGFKGELSYFHPEEDLMDASGTFTSTLGLDYMFENGLYTQAEVLYNGGYERSREGLSGLTQPPGADNLFISDTGYFLNFSHSLSPLTGIGFGTLGSFSSSLFIFIPQLSYSLSQDIDLLLLAQLLKGSEFDIEGLNSNLFFFRVKWSY